MQYNLNGKLIQGRFISAETNNRALNYGDGIFESMRFANNRINFWEDHYFRFMASMRIVRMEIPMSFSPEYLEEQIRKTIEANDLGKEAARVKLLTFRKSGGLYTPETNRVDFMITVSALNEAQFQLNEAGLEVDLFKDFYVQRGMLSNLKTTSKMLSVVASVYKKENKLDECFLLNDDKALTEAISSNVFLVKGKEVFTPPLSSGCLKGVMRKQVLALLPEMGYSVKEESINPFELQKADEVFLTNSISGVKWVGQYRKKKYGNEVSKALIKRLNVAVVMA
jgi:branched-chain amino acid aminotransferase